MQLEAGCSLNPSILNNSKLETFHLELVELNLSTKPKSCSPRRRRRRRAATPELEFPSFPSPVQCPNPKSLPSSWNRRKLARCPANIRWIIRWISGGQSVDDPVDDPPEIRRASGGHIADILRTLTDIRLIYLEDIRRTFGVNRVQSSNATKSVHLYFYVPMSLCIYI